MRIISKARRPGGSYIPMGDIEYHFRPEPVDGVPEVRWPHVADVQDEAHIERFLSIKDGFERDPNEIAAEDTARREQHQRLMHLTSFEGAVVDLAQRAATEPSDAIVDALRKLCGIDETAGEVEGAGSGEASVPAQQASNAGPAPDGGEPQEAPEPSGDLLERVLEAVSDDGRLTKAEAQALYREFAGEDAKPMWTKAKILDEMKERLTKAG